MEEIITEIITAKATDIFAKNQHYESPMPWEIARESAALEVMTFIREQFLNVPEPDYGEYAQGGYPEDLTSQDDDQFYKDKEEETDNVYTNTSQVEGTPEETETPYDNLTMEEFLDKFDFYDKKKNNDLHY